MTEQPFNTLLPARSDPARIRWLVSALMASCTLPLVGALVPVSIPWMPLLWATFTPPAGVMLTLSFWIGLGNAPFLARLIAGVVGAVYIFLSLVTANVARQLLSGGRLEGNFSMYVAQAASIAATVAVLSGIFMILRRWWTLQPAIASDAATAPKSQFSILYVLLLTAAVAILLTLVRVSRDSLAASDSSLIAVNILGIVAFAVNAVCASFAALRPMTIRRNCILVLIVAYLLGIALSFGANHDLYSWVLIAFGPIISVLPTAILLGSLLVVRSTGYRLLRKSDVSSPTHEQPLDASGALPLNSADAAEAAS